MMVAETDGVQTYLSTKQVKDLYIYVGQKVIEAKPTLTEIDSAIGDGDHGIGMEVGFKKAIQQLNEIEVEDINTIYKEIGKAMISNMGGASGVLFGTFFVASVKNKPVIDRLTLATFAQLVQSGLEGVQARGKAKVGDKTMIDALAPAVEALNAAVEQNKDLVEALQVASEEAKLGLEQTKQLVAKFGRAKSLGERAIGHQDAGATTISIIFKSIFDYVCNLKTNGELLYE